jgi:subtilisin family serine protease
LSPRYKFANGLGIGSPERKIKETFGDGFKLRETKWKDFIIYRNEGLQFEIHKKNRTVMEFTVTQKNARELGGPFAAEIKSVNEYDDVRWKNLSKLDLSARRGLVNTLTFNQKTVWPEQAKMPPGSDPNKILTDALNPGLGIRKLHQQGITGRGVNVAIIDQPTYLVHPEFAGKIVAYHDTCCETDESSMHGPLVASLLVGTNCGTAPDARVYYAAAPSWKMDAAYYAKGLDWIIAQNETLPEEDKIRVVSVSAAPNQSSWANRQMWDRACDRAETYGITVLDCTNSRRGFIGRCWYNARIPESVAQCNPWAPPNTEFRPDPTDISILVPSSPRTAAEDGDVPGYQYAGRGGLSRAIPYCAGVLAMGWQVNPDLSPEQMRALLFESAYTKQNGAKIINPKKFIHLVKRTAPRTR